METHEVRPAPAPWGAGFFLVSVEEACDTSIMTWRLHNPHETGHLGPLLVGDRRKGLRFKQYSLSENSDRHPKMFRRQQKARKLAQECADHSGEPCPVYGWTGYAFHLIEVINPKAPCDRCASRRKIAIGDEIISCPDCGGRP